jgi:hypothetical protein
MLWVGVSHTEAQKMGEKLGMSFWGILGWLIFGDVLKTCEFEFDFEFDYFEYI